VAKYILKKKSHYKFCPCCREPEVDGPETPMQMAEFLEYIK